LPNKITARQQMQQGEWPQGGCEYCEKIERAGGTSDRQQQLQANHVGEITPRELYADPASVEVVPTILEIYFNNTCNMSCLYCGSHFSSKWEEENRKFGVYTNAADTVSFGWDRKQPDLDYDRMLEDFWRYLAENNRYQHLRQYQIAGGEPFYQVELEQSIDFWDQHPNPDLTFNFITNLKVNPRKFQSTIDRLGQMVSQGRIGRVQISSSLDCWGPQQEYTRWGLKLSEWVENFEYLLDKPFVQQCINSAINPLSIKTMPELIERIAHWDSRKPQYQRISYSFMSVMAPHWMDPAIFGAGVFDRDFEKICQLMPNHNQYDQATVDHMRGIGQQIAASPRNPAMIHGLIDYLDEIDRRRCTNWRDLFPWLDQDWH
jgi:hypothetical protein